MSNRSKNSAPGDVAGQMRVYWRVGSEKKIAKRYRKGWRARHLQWAPDSERLMVLWERAVPQSANGTIST